MVGAAGRGVFWSILAVGLLVPGCSSPAEESPPEALTLEPLVDRPGFVVWESNRSGRWRLWRSELRDGRPTRLTVDAQDERHCCAHISPDGSRLVYLALPEGRQRYLDQGAVGELRLLTFESSEVRPLGTARTYFEHRAAVWRDDRQVHYISEDGSVRTLDVDSGADSILLGVPDDLDRRWLANSSATWAATGRGALAPVEDGVLGVETPLPGCQPYFSHDGRWGFWTAGAGGPIDRFELSSGRASTLLRKSDDRLPRDRGYLYFPMLSRDGTLLVFAASDGDHDHYSADYDLFAAEVDPQTLEVLGRPWPIAAHPAVDRFPDVWRRPLELGRTVDEIPFDLTVESPDGRPRLWTLGDDTRETVRFETTVTRPGIHSLTARTGDRLEHGVVIAVEPVAAPGWNDGWPVLGRGALWFWSAASGMGTTPLEDHPGGAIRPADGQVTAEQTAELLNSGLRRTNQLAIEILMTTPTRVAEGGVILRVGRDHSRQSFSLNQRGDRLELRMRVGARGREAYGRTDLGAVTPGQRLHLVVNYSPGRTTVYRDGRLALRKQDLIGHFYHWRPYPLNFGHGGDWRGEIEALAIYDRPMSAEEARRAALSLGLAGD